MKLQIDETFVLGVIDAQLCFMPGGSLGVEGGRWIIDPTCKSIRKFPDGQIFSSEDAHPDDHCSFKENGGQWQKHGVRGAREAEIEPAILFELQKKQYFRWLKAGEKMVDAYGAFKDLNGNRSGLAEQLRWRGFKTLVLCGLAFDVCVGETAKQGIEEGFEVYILEDATRAVFPKKYEEKKAELIAIGVKFIKSEDLIAA